MVVRPRDPLRTFQFRVKFEESTVDGDYIAGVRSVSGLSWNIASYEIWSGGNNVHPYATPNRVSWEPITLEQGIDRDGRLEAWAEAARAMAEVPASTSASEARRTLRIDVWDPALLGGQPGAASAPQAASSTPAAGSDSAGAIIYSYLVYNAWVSKYVALPRLDATTSEIAVASVEIIHEGWRRSPSNAS